MLLFSKIKDMPIRSKIYISFQVKKIILLIAIPLILEIIYISENLEFIYLSFEKSQTLSLGYMQTGPGWSNLKPYLEF
jgi:hypothetical protein